MTNKELQEKIAHLETELTEVKEMAMSMKKRADGGGVFKPEDRERYWYISHAGKAYTSGWDNDHVDHDRYAIGNCFPTEQAAEDTVRALKLIQKSRESQDGFAPDWEDSTQKKHTLYFDWTQGKVYVTNYRVLEMAPIFGYWEGASACDQFIQDNHDELLWFFTEYER